MAAGFTILKSDISRPARKFFFDITNAIFYTAFFVAFSDGAGRYGKTVVIGEVQIFGIENRILAQDAVEYCGLKVVYHDFFGTPSRLKAF